MRKLYIPPSGTRRTLLLLSSRRLIRLHGFDKGFGVDELLDLLDLQTPAFVGDVCGDDRFVSRLQSEYGLCFVGELWGKYHVKCVQC